MNIPKASRLKGIFCLRKQSWPTGGIAGCRVQWMMLLISLRQSGDTEALPDAAHELVADVAVGLKPLVAAAFGDRRVGRRPVFDLGSDRAGQFERLVMGLRRQRDDEIEVEALPSPRAPRTSSVGGRRYRGRSLPWRPPQTDRARPCARRPSPHRSSARTGASSAPPPSASAPRSARRRTAPPAGVRRERAPPRLTLSNEARRSV